MKIEHGGENIKEDKCTEWQGEHLKKINWLFLSLKVNTT